MHGKKGKNFSLDRLKRLAIDSLANGAHEYLTMSRAIQ